MYNYQTFLREQSLQKCIDSAKKEHELTALKRELSSPQLVQAHKKRVEGFVLSAIDQPIKVQQYKNKPQSFREASSKGSLGAKGFFLRRESQPQRIASQMAKNGELDNVPFTNTSNHQFRDSKGQGWHYKSFTRHFRVREYLDRQELNYLPNTPALVDRMLKKEKKWQKADLEKLNNVLNKTLLPMLHQKTYFKSLSTLFTQIPDKDYSLQIYTPNDEGQEVQERRNTKPKDFVSRKENARDALVKCNMLRDNLRG